MQIPVEEQLGSFWSVASCSQRGTCTYSMLLLFDFICSGYQSHWLSVDNHCGQQLPCEPPRGKTNNVVSEQV